MPIDRTSLDSLRIERRPDPPRRRGVATAVAIGGALLAVIIGFLLTRPSRPEVKVATVHAARGNAPSSVLNATGYVTARRQATVSSKITGKVTEVFIDEGMHVEAGQILAKLDAAAPSKALDLAKAQQREAQSALNETRVRIEEAQADLNRASALADQQISARADYDHAKAALGALQARLANQQDAFASAQHLVALRQQDVDDNVIRAPFAGIVVSKNAQPGEMISPISAGGGFTRTGICTIVDMASLEIEVDVNESYIHRVHANQPVEAVLDAYPDWKIPAHVITVIPTADRQKATVKVRIAFDTKDPRILPDMGVKVAFIESAAAGAAPTVTVPKSALRREGEQDVVFLVGSDNKLERRAVKVAGTSGDQVTLSSGVNDGETLVVAGPETLKDGQPVKIAKEKE